MNKRQKAAWLISVLICIPYSIAFCLLPTFMFFVTLSLMFCAGIILLLAWHEGEFDD